MGQREVQSSLACLKILLGDFLLFVLSDLIVDPPLEDRLLLLELCDLSAKRFDIFINLVFDDLGAHLLSMPGASAVIRRRGLCASACVACWARVTRLGLCRRVQS